MRTIFLVIVSLLPLLFAFVTKPKITHKSTGLVYIPAGSFNEGETIYSVNSMFMSDHEVTNNEYRLFLQSLKTENRMKEFEKCYPDTAAWNKYIPYAYNEPMMNMYFWHPAYDNYPVVNITVEGAELYCKWLQENLSSTYGADQVAEVRLPTSGEWTYAAAGGSERPVYSWNSHYVRDEEGKFLGNFKPVGDEFITTQDSVAIVVKNWSSSYYLDGAFYMAPTDAYTPNGYGLYNMSGNVSELVVEQGLTAGLDVEKTGYTAMGGNWNSTGYDIRITSKMAFEKPNPFVGFRPVVVMK